MSTSEGPTSSEPRSILAADGTLISSETTYRRSSTYTISSTCSNAEEFRPRFHEEMERLTEAFEVTMLEKISERIDGQIVYQVDCPLDRPNSETVATMVLRIWCADDADDRFVLGYQISDKTINAIEDLFFKSALEKPWRRSLMALLSDFYLHMESVWYPNPVLFCRDFAYPICSSLHFGHFSKAIAASIPAVENYEARAIYSYTAAVEGELSLEPDDLLLVMKNLGNGWVCARRKSQTGLVPENYIQRVFKK